jgi:hypothetical protein
MKRKHNLPPWLKPKAPARTLQVGVGWYTADERQKVKASATDPERFEATFEEWLAMAEESLAQLRANGINAEESYVVASELLAWCLAKGRSNDASSRAEFVSQQGRKASAPGA